MRPGVPVGVPCHPISATRVVFGESTGGYMAARVAVVRNWEGTVVTRPRVIVRPKRIEDIQTILENTKAFPSPVRAIGGNYSQTRCGVADGGTLIDMTAMNRILEITEHTVRVQAGAQFIDVAA